MTKPALLHVPDGDGVGTTLDGIMTMVGVIGSTAVLIDVTNRLVEMVLADVADDTEDIALLNVTLVDILDIVEIRSLLNAGLTVIIDTLEAVT